MSHFMRHHWIKLLVFSFPIFFYMLRSPFPSYDGESWLRLINQGDFKELMYGSFHHFFSLVAVRTLWVWPHSQFGTSIETVFLFLNTLVVLIGIFGVRKFVRLWTQDTRLADWATLLFTYSHLIWFTWNLEKTPWAASFIPWSLALALEKKIGRAALVWGLAVYTHFEYVWVFPAYWILLDRKLKPTFLIWVLGAIASLSLIIGSGWLVGKFTSVPGLIDWFRGPATHIVNELFDPQPFKAMKGYLGTVFSGVHGIGAVIKNRSDSISMSHWFVTGYTIVLLGWSTISVVLNFKKSPLIRKTVLLAGVWILPMHLLFNSIYCPTVEKYHASKQLSLILLIIIPLQATLLSRAPFQRLISQTILAFFPLVTALGTILPARSYGVGMKDFQSFHQELVTKSKIESTEFAALICDWETPHFGGWHPHYAIQNDLAFDLEHRGISGTVGLESWIRDQIRTGHQLIVFGPKCEGTDWNLWETHRNPQLPDWVTQFNYSYLEVKGWFTLKPIGPERLPLNATAQGNPLNWRWTRAYELRPGPKYDEFMNP